jgi:hypothetical protein
MHIDDIIKSCENVIKRAEKGESLTGDDRIVKGSGVIIRGLAVKVDYAVKRGERPEVAELNKTGVTAAAVTLARVGVNKRATANHRS